jgi:hypothetical protein
VGVQNEKKKCVVIKMSRVRELFLPWKSNKYYILYLSVCACVLVCVPRRVNMYMSVHACSLTYPAYNRYVPYCDVICGLPDSTTFFNIIS